MRLIHSALTCAHEESADKFYKDLLGLVKQEPKILSAHLSKQIFNIDSDIRMINYMNENLHFEIFIHDRKQNEFPIIEHICLQVEDREAFLEKCRNMGVKILQVPKGDKIVVFISDFDGHLFEIK